MKNQAYCSCPRPEDYKCPDNPRDCPKSEAYKIIRIITLSLPE